MNRRPRDLSDRRLAPTFCQNARSFHAMAREARERHGGDQAYFLAIAIELSLKAYLLHRGITDQWNRVHLRHDLTKALRSARRAGFICVPVGLPTMAEALNTAYASGALSRGHMAAPLPLSPEAVDRTVSALLEAVEAVIEDRARSGR